MSEWRNAPGLIEPVIYFENKEGKIIIAPDVRHPTPDGFERKECRTLAEIDKITRQMNSQDKQEWEMLNAKDRARFHDRREAIRTKLRQRMLAVDCSQFERRFIQHAMAYMDRKQEELYRFKLEGYFHQREFDKSSVDTSKVKEAVKMPKLSDRLASVLTQ